MSKIRPPSPTLNRIRPISIPTGVTEPVKGLKEAKSYSEAFISCLRSLIFELRVNPKYSDGVKLANGERQNDFQNNYGSTYTFGKDINIRAYDKKWWIKNLIQYFGNFIKAFIYVNLPI